MPSEPARVVHHVGGAEPAADDVRALGRRAAAERVGQRLAARAHVMQRDDRLRPGQPDERRADGLGHGLVKLVRNDTANVISLEDLVQIRHFVPAFLTACHPRLPGSDEPVRIKLDRSPAMPSLLTSQDQPIGHAAIACKRGLPGACGPLRPRAGARGRSAPPAGDRGGRPRRPGRPARRRPRRCARPRRGARRRLPRLRLPQLARACRSGGRRARRARARLARSARPTSRTTFASASRSSARSCAGSGGSRTTSQPRGTTSRAACISHRSHECGST